MKMIDREVYYKQINEKYAERKVKKPWDQAQLDHVVEIIRSFTRKKQDGRRDLTPAEKYYSKNYDLVEVAGVSKVMPKRKFVHDEVRYMVPIEDFYDLILESHEATGHGGRDKMIHFLKDKYIIPRLAIEIFTSLCTLCNSKKNQKHNDLGIKSIIPRDFNIIGQIDIIDLQSCADQSFKWLLYYQDYATTFLHLIPLHSKEASEVALELLKIFLQQGPPKILQNDNNSEFVSHVIEELMKL